MSGQPIWKREGYASPYFRRVALARERAAREGRPPPRTAREAAGHRPPGRRPKPIQTPAGEIRPNMTPGRTGSLLGNLRGDRVVSFLVTVRGFDNLEREIPVFGRGGIRVSSLLSLIDGQPFAEWLTEQIAEGGLGVSDPTGGGVASIVNIQVITK